MVHTGRGGLATSGGDLAMNGKAYELRQNVPNPFYRSTRIQLELSQPAAVNVAVYDVAGRLVNTLLEGDRAPGTYTVTWEGRNAVEEALSVGVYYLRFTARLTDGRRLQETRRMIYLK